MSDTPLKGLVIRAAVARKPGLGFIYAADPEKEADEVPHAITFKYRNGSFTRGEANYDAHSLTAITKPDPGLIDVSGAGYYAANMASGMTLGDIFDQSAPPPPKPRTTGIRSVATVAGQAYAIGLRGMVYRFDGPKRWTRIDDGLPESFEGQAIHGFSDSEIYAVGRDGAMWQFDGHNWLQRDLPTSVTLTCVHCAGDGNVYLGGHRGTLLRGRGDSWAIIDHGETEDNIWDVEWFIDRLYVSTMAHLYHLDGSTLAEVDFGADRPKTCYQLSVGEGVMWSVGEFDIMVFDGTRWARIV